MALTSSIALALGVATGLSAEHQITVGKDLNGSNGVVTFTGSVKSGVDRRNVGPDGEIVPADRSATAAEIGSLNDHVEQAASDLWTTAKVNASLMLTPALDSFEITVTTIAGVVSLRGAVDNAAEHELAVQLVQGIRGVREVDAVGLKVG